MKLDSLINKCETFHKLARKQDDLAVLKANIGNYIHFSDSERFGISYNKVYNIENPRGVYGFPLTPEHYQSITENKPHSNIEDYAISKYIYIFNTSGTILNLDDFDIKEVGAKIYNFFLSQYSGRVDKSRLKILHDYVDKLINSGTYGLTNLHNIIHGILQTMKKAEILFNTHSGFNVIMRGAGYDAMETRYYGFRDQIKQEICVLDPSKVNLIAKINNPMITKEDLKEINWYQSEEYQEQKRQKTLQREESERNAEALHKEYNEGRRRVDELERQLFKEKKYDEAMAVVREFNAKWKDVF